MKMKAINFHRQAEAALDELTVATGLSIAEMVRRAVDEYLAREYAKMEKRLPTFKEASK